MSNNKGCCNTAKNNQQKSWTSKNTFKVPFWVLWTYFSRLNINYTRTPVNYRAYFAMCVYRITLNRNDIKYVSAGRQHLLALLQLTPTKQKVQVRLYHKVANFIESVVFSVFFMNCFSWILIHEANRNITEKLIALFQIMADVVTQTNKIIFIAQLCRFHSNN